MKLDMILFSNNQDIILFRKDARQFIPIARDSITNISREGGTGNIKITSVETSDGVTGKSYYDISFVSIHEAEQFIEAFNKDCLVDKNFSVKYLK